MKTFSRLLRNESAQAMVETAIVCPMVIFFMLGVIQLGMMQQARLMVEYAAFNAARAGSVWNMSQWHMHRAAELSLVPTRPRFPGVALAGRIENHADLFASYLEVVAANAGADAATSLIPNLGEDLSMDAKIINVDILNPRSEHFGESEELDFDNPALRKSTQLTIRLTYFYKLVIPFANWVIYNAWFELRAQQLGLATWILSLANQLGANFSILNRPFLAFDAKNYFLDSSALGLILGLLNSNDISNNYEGLNYGDFFMLATLASAEQYYMPLITAHTIRMQSNPYKCVVEGNCNSADNKYSAGLVSGLLGQ